MTFRKSNFQVVTSYRDIKGHYFGTCLQKRWHCAVLKAASIYKKRSLWKTFAVTFQLHEFISFWFMCVLLFRIRRDGVCKNLLLAEKLPVLYAKMLPLKSDVQGDIRALTTATYFIGIFLNICATCLLNKNCVI